MAQNTREIRRRIKSVKNTKQITKAMELVAASKMRKSQERVLATRDYAVAAWQMLTDVATASKEEEHPLLDARPVKKMCVLLFTSNRGLAGGFNTNVIKKVVAQLEDPTLLATQRVNGVRISPADPKNMVINFITIGKKGENAVRRMGKTIVASFPDLSDTPVVEEMIPIASVSIEEYRKGTYDKIVLVYADFVSTISQVPRLRQLLPLSVHDVEKMINEADDAEDEYVQKDVKAAASVSPYLYEPSADAVLDRVITSLAEVQIYQALLESRASEHAARMMAMKSATDNANEMIDELTLFYNQARQAAITQEIAEIAAGSAALD